MKPDKTLRSSPQPDLIGGNMALTVARFALPFLASCFLQTLYGMADLFIIGQFCGKESTAAVSVGSQVMHMITVVLVGLSMGVTVRVARAVGAGDREEAAKVIGTSVTVFSVIALVSAAGLALCVKGVVRAMFTPAEAVDGAVSYLTICFLGVPLIVAFNLCSAVFRGLGDSRSPTLFVAAACAANIGFDYLFIGRFGMGPRGAALGTVLGQAVSVFCAAVFLLRRDIGVKVRRGHLRPQKKTALAVFGVGLPIAVQDGFIQISFLVITMIANRRSLDTAAAVGVVEKLICFFFLVPSAMLSTVSAVAAQNLGAGRPDRAKQCLRYAVIAAAAFGLAVSVLMQFFAEPAVALFTKDGAVVRLGGQYLRGYIWDCMLAGVHFCFSGYFCALSMSMLSFLHNAVSIVCARVPLAYYASVRFTETLFPMGLAPTVGSLLSVIICLIMYWRLERKPSAVNTEKCQI